MYTHTISCYTSCCCITGMEDDKGGGLNAATTILILTYQNLSCDWKDFSSNLALHLHEVATFQKINQK